MRAIIIGAGSAGRLLAERLCVEQQDVVVVDRRREPLEALEAQLDVMTVQGAGANPRVLGEAGLAQANLLVAVTAEDETNLLACAFAKAAGVPFRVARLGSADYLHPDCPMPPEQFGVDLPIQPKKECARDIARLLRLPGSQEVVPLLGGRILLVGFEISERSSVRDVPLHAFPDAALLERIRFVAVRREGRVTIPQGDTRLRTGDEVYAAAAPDAVPALLRLGGDEPRPVRRAIVAGGGDLGIELARSFEADDLPVTLIEQDEQRAAECAAALERTLVVRANVLDKDALKEAGLNEETAFIAATGDEENNIIGCLLAGKAGAGLTMAQIVTPEYVPIINSLNLLDRAVSPHLSAVNAILRFIRGRHVRAATALQTLPGELIEVALEAGAPWAGRAVRDLRLPRNAVIVATRRGEEVVVPTGARSLEAGDSLVLYAVGSAIGKLKSIFHS